ncbi:MAG: Smr/MutS family protein [Bacilli bacterium]|nr:Smr/MutS family protein [Bacilli bacterium]
MKLNEIIFPDSLPKLDLHGYDRQTAEVEINDFIKENQILKRPNFVIVHGIGTGILKNTTFETLKKNKNVLEFKTLYNNNGCTIVHIKIDKNSILC